MLRRLKDTDSWLPSLMGHIPFLSSHISKGSVPGAEWNATLRAFVCLPGSILSKLQALRGIGKACGRGPQLPCPPHSFTFDMKVETSHITCLKVCKGNKRPSCNLHPSFYICNMTRHNFLHKQWNYHCFQTSTVSSRKIVQ